MVEHRATKHGHDSTYLKMLWTVQGRVPFNISDFLSQYSSLIIALSLLQSLHLYVRKHYLPHV